MTARVLREEDLMRVYLSGFGTGIATVYANAGVPPEEADTRASRMVDLLLDDPDAFHEVRRELRELVEGVDSGSRTVQVNHRNKGEMN